MAGFRTKIVQSYRSDVSCFWSGGDHVLTPAAWQCHCFDVFSLELILKTVEKFEVTHMWVVPPIILALAKDNVVKKYNLSSLKHIGSGAAPLGRELMQECAKNFPQAVVMQGYGMTETCGIVSLENAYAGPRHSSSAGSLAPGVECQIVSVDILKPLRPGQLGKIWVRGQNMMQGNEEVKLAILSCLASWAVKLAEAISPDLVTFIVSGLKEKETLRRGYLRCMRLFILNISYFC